MPAVPLDGAVLAWEYVLMKTEHTGAKKGKGAFYGRKADAKDVSNSARRAQDRIATCGHGVSLSEDCDECTYENMLADSERN
jgi:hypothetical protein